MKNADLNYLTDHRSDPDTRVVLEDLEREIFRRSTVARLGYVLTLLHAPADNSDTDATPADNSDTDSDTDATYDVNAHTAADAAAEDDAAAAAADAIDNGAPVDDTDDEADDTDAAADAADSDTDDKTDEADADACTAADATIEADATIGAHYLTLIEEPSMEEGLKILQIQVTAWRAITFVGWLRRVSGDEYHLLGARIVTRKPGQPWSWNGIAELAEQGPRDRYHLAPIMKSPEELHRLGNIKRSKPADEQVWAEHCPKPNDWE